MELIDVTAAEEVAGIGVQKQTGEGSPPLAVADERGAGGCSPINNRGVIDLPEVG